VGKIVIPYKPRDAFVAYHESTKRFSLTVAHRRAGKTVARINKLIRKAAECELHNPRFGYLAPFYVQAKDIAWLYLKHYAGPLLEYGGKSNESELSITLPHNNAIIRLYGAENAERMRGLYFDGLVVDEGQGIAKPVLTQIILPALADRRGWLDVSGTPKGWVNLLGELLKLAKARPDEWFVQILKASETGLINAQELEQQRALMSEDEYAQEFECDFDAAITGAYYGVLMREAGPRILHIDHDPQFPVYTAWDIGRRDDTAIWWYQVIGSEVRVIDYHASSLKDVAYYAGQLLGRRVTIDFVGDEVRVGKHEYIPGLERRLSYRYAQHWLPHDARAWTLAAKRSVIEQLMAAVGNCQIAPDLDIQDGIQAVRMMLPRTWFNSTWCEDGIEALKNYQREWDEDSKVFKKTPKHDWTSHPADAFRMLALSWRAEFKPQREPQEIRGLAVGNPHGVTLEEAWAMTPRPTERI